MISKNSINKVILIGRVGQDPEIKYTPTGFSVSTFSLATNEQWLDLENNKNDSIIFNHLGYKNKKVPVLDLVRKIYMEKNMLYGDLVEITSSRKETRL